MKHFLITIVLAVFTAIQVHAKEAIVDGLRYSLFEDTHEAMVDFGNKWVGELTIPSEISVNGQTYTVSKIAWKAFSFCVSLTRVTIPKTVREIWNDLNEKDLNTSFIGCLNLEAIEVEEGNSSFCSVDGVLFNADTTSLYAYPAGKKEEHYVVPASVTSIARSAFMLSQSLVTVQIPKGVTCVGYEAFSNSERLEEVYLPSGITELSGNLFNYCKNLKHVNIPLGVTNIATCAFWNCSGLTSVIIPESVTSIGNYAFSGCTSLTSVVVNICSPLEISTWTFIHNIATLYVPKDSKAAYAAADVWKHFKAIKEFPDPDVNQDGTVDVVDVVDVARFVVGTPSESFEQFLADLNGSGEVNGADDLQTFLLTAARLHCNGCEVVL